MNTDNFLPDLGIALKSGAFSLNPELVITATAHNMLSQPWFCTSESVQFSEEIMGYLGTFIVEIPHQTLLETLLKRNLVSFTIESVGDIEIDGNNVEFRPILARLVS